MFYFAEAALNTHSFYVPSPNIQNIVSVSCYILHIHTHVEHFTENGKLAIYICCCLWLDDDIIINFHFEPWPGGWWLVCHPECWLAGASPPPPLLSSPNQTLPSLLRLRPRLCRLLLAHSLMFWHTFIRQPTEFVPTFWWNTQHASQTFLTPTKPLRKHLPKL